MDTKYRVPFKRRRNNKTNYKKRYNLLLSDKPRFVIRITNKQIIVQSVKYKTEGDLTLAHATSDELKEYGWSHAQKNIPAAYLTGLLCAKRATKNKINTGIIDFGLHTTHKKGRLFGAIKGLIDGGIEIPYNKDIIPDENRLQGTHLKKDASKELEKTKENIIKTDGVKDKKTKTTKKTDKKPKTKIITKK